jgi:hypothetical protein
MMMMMKKKKWQQLVRDMKLLALALHVININQMKQAF